MDAVFLTNTADASFHEMTLRAISSLRASAEGVDINVTVVESNRDGESLEFSYDGCRVIVPHEPFNYNRFMSIGLGAGSDHVVIMCNNDVEFLPRCVNNLLGAMVAYGLKSVSPYEPNWHRRYYGDTAPPQPVIGYDVENHVCGWCICAERALLERPGVLDQEFEFWYQDNNYAMKLKSMGVAHALVPQALALHRFSRSHELLGDKKHAMTHGQSDVLVRKWSS